MLIGGDDSAEAEPELAVREQRLHDTVRNNRIGDFVRLRQTYLAPLDTAA
jgi:hypothetical protein